MAKTVIPDDFSISEDLRAWAEKAVPQVNIDREHENFMDYWRGHGKKMADWNATWRGWMRRAPKMGGALYSAEELEIRALIREFTQRGFRRAFVHETARMYRFAFEQSQSQALPRRDLNMIRDVAAAKRMPK